MLEELAAIGRHSRVMTWLIGIGDSPSSGLCRRNLNRRSRYSDHTIRRSACLSQVDSALSGGVLLLLLPQDLQRTGNDELAVR